jgi:hypothetical protein
MRYLVLLTDGDVDSQEIDRILHEAGAVVVRSLTRKRPWWAFWRRRSTASSLLASMYGQSSMTRRRK